MRDESFGPIIGIQAVADDDAAVELMNDTRIRPHGRRLHARRRRARSILRARRTRAASTGTAAIA